MYERLSHNLGHWYNFDHRQNQIVKNPLPLILGHYLCLINVIRMNKISKTKYLLFVLLLSLLRTDIFPLMLSKKIVWL